jgi:hypothetical protein
MRGHFGDAGAGLVHMQRQPFGGCGKPAIGVVKLLLGMEPLRVMVENLKRDENFIVFMQFPDVADVKFGHIGGASGLLIVRSEAQKLIGLIDGRIEQDVVIRHVEVTVEIDPLRAHPHH